MQTHSIHVVFLLTACEEKKTKHGQLLILVLVCPCFENDLFYSCILNLNFIVTDHPLVSDNLTDSGRQLLRVMQGRNLSLLPCLSFSRACTRE